MTPVLQLKNESNEFFGEHKQNEISPKDSCFEAGIYFVNFDYV